MIEPARLWTSTKQYGRSLVCKSNVATPPSSAKTLASVDRGVAPPGGPQLATNAGNAPAPATQTAGTGGLYLHGNFLSPDTHDTQSSYPLPSFNSTQNLRSQAGADSYTSPPLRSPHRSSRQRGPAQSAMGPMPKLKAGGCPALQARGVLRFGILARCEAIAPCLVPHWGSRRSAPTVGHSPCSGVNSSLTIAAAHWIKSKFPNRAADVQCTAARREARASEALANSKPHVEDDIALQEKR
ncbi:hypothetical protein G7046_g1889 [Stylonectria norvegica]|nr:hypothetical protein G7046_g1889 [Stylonectria norvegica]